MSTVSAQEKPTPAVQRAISGTWHLDQSRSDALGADPLAGAIGGGRAFPGAGVGGGDAGAGGGGRGGRGGGGGARAPIAAPSDSAAGQPTEDRPASRRRDPHLGLVIGDMNPGSRMTIGVNDSAITIARATGQLSSFRTDGRKRQAAQMDGSIIETQALWKGDILQVITGVANVASLKREFKMSKDGHVLEMKETLDASGRKVDKKLWFTRQ
ncbi:MAG: hypothetical protein ACRELE_12375 [Gemmatimonadales bacterium]